MPYKPRKKRVKTVRQDAAEQMSLAIAQRVIQATILAGAEVLRVEYGYTNNQVAEWAILTSKRTAAILGAEDE